MEGMDEMKHHFHKKHGQDEGKVAQEGASAQAAETEAKASAGDEEAAPSEARDAGTEGTDAGGAAEETKEVASEAEEGEEAAPSEAEVLKGRLLRLQADFENFKKRQLRERQEWIASASAEVLKELLPVLDNFERGIQSASGKPENAALLEGFSLVFGQLKGVLAKAGAEEIPTEGKAFDPTLHEAITSMPSAEVPEGQILVVTRRGYTLGGKVLRAAQVGVSSGAPEGAAEGAAAAAVAAEAPAAAAEGEEGKTSAE